MSEVASRELRNNTRGLLQRVAGGEDIVITVDGQPVAALRSLNLRPRWISGADFARRLARRQAASGTACSVARHDRRPPIVTRGLADTSVFIARESDRPLQESLFPNELAVSIITIGELRAGVLATNDVKIRDQRLATLTAAMTLDPVTVDDDVAAQWARLRVLLRDSGQRMLVNDSWIAATAMALDVPIVTQDDDYIRLAELPVIRV